MLLKKGKISCCKIDNIKSIPKDKWATKFLLGKLSSLKDKAKLSSMKNSLKDSVYFISYSEQTICD